MTMVILKYVHKFLNTPPFKSGASFSSPWKWAGLSDALPTKRIQQKSGSAPVDARLWKLRLLLIFPLRSLGVGKARCKDMRTLTMEGPMRWGMGAFCQQPCDLASRWIPKSLSNQQTPVATANIVVAASWKNLSQSHSAKLLPNFDSQKLWD